MPLFVKANSLVPLAKPVQQVDRETVFKIAVHAFGKNPVPFTLFEDDGTTFDFETGAISRVVPSWNKPTGGGKVERAGSFADRRYEVGGWVAEPEPEQ